MLHSHVCEPAVLRHHRAVITGSGFAQTDLNGGHGLGPCVVLVPKRDRAGAVRTDINVAADIPPISLHALIGAVAAAHLPPAVPFAVPPVKQFVAGRGRQRGIRARIVGRFPFERSRVNGDRAFFLAEQLLKGRLDFGSSVLEHISRFDLNRRTRSNFRELSFYYGFKGIVIGKDSCNFQFCAVLHDRFINAPKIRCIFLAFVCEVQCQNNCIISVRILHDARTLVEQLIVIELD